MAVISKQKWQQRIDSARMTKELKDASYDRRHRRHVRYYRDFIELPNLTTDAELSAKIDIAMLNLALVRIKNQEPVRLPTLRRDIRCMIDDLDFKTCDHDELELYFHLVYLNQWFSYEILPQRDVYKTLHGPSDDNVYIRDWFQTRLDHAIRFTIEQLSKLGLVDKTPIDTHTDPNYIELKATDSITIK